MIQSVSVIICTYNRCQLLKGVLDSLLNQKNIVNYAYEILVIDNNSTDLTKSIVLDYEKLFEGRLKYFFEPQQGKSYALNKAVEVATGNILAFTDDDVILDELWLAKLLECYDRYDCDGVGGRVLPIYSADTPQWVKDNAIKLSGSVVIYDYGQDIITFKETMYRFIGANYSFKKEVFNQVGLFNLEFKVGEDTQFVERLLKNGKKLYYCGEALVWHPFDFKRLTLKHVARWNLALGKFAVHKEIESGEKFISYFGIPRYLFKGVVLDIFKILFSCFNYLALLNSWRSFFRKVGMIQEYINLSKKQRVL